MMLIALLQLSIMGKKFIRNPALDLDWKPINWSVCLPSNYVYTRTPAEEMYKVLISDLRYAVENLPENYSSGEFGRATKYAAAHLLSKIYLHREQGKEYGTVEYGRNADGSIDT